MKFKFFSSWSYQHIEDDMNAFFAQQHLMPVSMQLSSVISSETTTITVLVMYDELNEVNLDSKTRL